MASSHVSVITRKVQSHRPSRITQGLDFLSRDNPWPEFPYGEVVPFEFALDANGRAGRDLILEEIDRRDAKLLIEVGCFLGGSVLHWLRHKRDLKVVGIDPWDDNWASIIESMHTDPVMSRHLWHFSDEQVAEIVRQLRVYGNYCVTLNNLRRYRARFYPLRRFAPEALYYLQRRGIQPDIVYIDAGKDPEDIWITHALWPDATICGDDWLWFDAAGVSPIQEGVKRFCEAHGFSWRSNRQTWIIDKP